MDGIKIPNAGDIPTFSPFSVYTWTTNPFYGEVTASQLFATYPEWREKRENYQPSPEMIGKLGG